MLTIPVGHFLSVLTETLGARETYPGNYPNAHLLAPCSTSCTQDRTNSALAETELAGETFGACKQGQA